MADMGQKSSFKTVNHKHLPTVNVNKSIFLGPKWVKPDTNHQGREIFLGFLQKIAAKCNLCKSNTQILTFLKTL